MVENFGSERYKESGCFHVFSYCVEFISVDGYLGNGCRMEFVYCIVRLTARVLSRVISSGCALDARKK